MLSDLDAGRLPIAVSRELTRLARLDGVTTDPNKHVRAAEFELRSYRRKHPGRHLEKACARLLLALANGSSD
jgi:hypothetical protein